MDDYVSKPLDPYGLFTAIARHTSGPSVAANAGASRRSVPARQMGENDMRVAIGFIKRLGD
jgi:hypothetical protein